MSLEKRLRIEEGERNFVYDDATGKPIVPGSVVIGHPTIGIGRCLDERGISKEEKEAFFQRDVSDSRAAAAAQPWAASLDPTRRDLIAEMIFEMGLDRLLRFEKMIAALQRKDFAAAAVEMRDSRWAGQVGQRAINLAAIMESGVDPDAD